MRPARMSKATQRHTHTLRLLGACFVGYLGGELVHALMHGLTVVAVPIFF